MKTVIIYGSSPRHQLCKLEDDTILAFEDTDGRIMRIEYDIKGAYKTPLVIL